MKMPKQTKEHKMNMPKQTMGHQMKMPMERNSYTKLLIMTLLSFVSMYVLMYAMVNSFENVIPNINQFYMAGLMTIPMILIEIILMRSMYTNRKLNYIIITVSSVMLIVFFLFIRQQTAVSDKQFLKSMIPHHASALLMCEKTKLQDPEIKALCTSIISGQQQEIDLMKTKLETIGK
jgi:uncharacterized protein (DUF305 family)